MKSKKVFFSSHMKSQIRSQHEIEKVFFSTNMKSQKVFFSVKNKIQHEVCMNFFFNQHEFFFQSKIKSNMKPQKVFFSTNMKSQIRS
jgi:hypothetical protein